MEGTRKVKLNDFENGTDYKLVNRRIVAFVTNSIAEALRVISNTEKDKFRLRL